MYAGQPALFNLRGKRKFDLLGTRRRLIGVLGAKVLPLQVARQPNLKRWTS
jgi:hypothetical protein